MGHFHLKHWKLGYASTTDAIHNQCLDQVQTVIRALGLTDVQSASVVTKKLPLERIKDIDSLSYPVIIITPEQGSINPAAGDNVNDDIGYGVGVTLVDADNQERTLEANLNKYLLWLEKVRRAFHCKRLANVSSVNVCHVSPFPPISEHHFLHGLWSSGHLLKFISRENRNA